MITNEWTQHALAQAIAAFDYPDREGVWRAEIALVQEKYGIGCCATAASDP